MTEVVAKPVPEAQASPDLPTAIKKIREDIWDLGSFEFQAGEASTPEGKGFYKVKRKKTLAKLSQKSESMNQILNDPKTVIDGLKIYSSLANSSFYSDEFSLLNPLADVFIQNLDKMRELYGKNPSLRDQIGKTVYDLWKNWGTKIKDNKYRPVLKRKCVTFFYGIFPISEAEISRSWRSGDTSPVLASLVMMSSGDEEQQTRAQNILQRAILDEFRITDSRFSVIKGRLRHVYRKFRGLKNVESERPDILKTVLEKSVSSPLNVNSKLRKLVESLLTPKGFDYSKLVDAWKASIGLTELGLAEKSVIQQVIAENIRTILQLEELRPGSSSLLNNEYGINNFHRYPLSLLLEMYDFHNKPNRDYILILYPYADNNNGFSTDHKMFEQLQLDLSRIGLSAKIIEVKGKVDLKQKSNYIQSRFSKAKDILIGGHGTFKSLQLGVDSSDGYLTLDDDLGEISGTLVEKGGTTIFNSCSTGKNGGIVSENAKRSGLVSIGPEYDGSIETIRVRGDKNNRVYSVEYVGSLGQRENPTKIYYPDEWQRKADI